MNCVLFDDNSIRENLLPLTYTRPVAQLRVGVDTISDKWRRYFADISWGTVEYLQGKFQLELAADNLLINGGLCPNKELLAAINDLKPGQGIYSGESTLAFRCDQDQASEFLETSSDLQNLEPYEGSYTLIDRTWKIFQNNGSELRQDIAYHMGQSTSFPIEDPHSRIYNPENVFVAENVKMMDAVIDASNGPVYLGKGSTLDPGSIIRGPFAMLDNSTLSMGARMRGDITIGPNCKVGGEVGNSIIMGYSNKAHDGYLGNSVIGEWCNLGADTNTSNMKNDYTDVKVWNYRTDRFESSGSTFCGLVMGDHSKSGINVMFNSGTTVGVSSSIYNANYPRNFIPSFVQGGAHGWNTLPIKKAADIANRAMSRRGKELVGEDLTIFEKVFELSASYRRK